MNELWKLQKTINNNNNKMIMGLIDQNQLLIKIIEDHEKDMMRMCEKINDLERRLSKAGL